MRWFYLLFGEGKDLDVLQMTDRAIVVFLLTLLLIRVAGIRTFGKHSAFDNVILITLGAVMSRAVVGASPFLSVTAACLAMSLLHRFIAWMSVQNHAMGRWVKGKCVCVFRNGQMVEENMRKAMISERDMLESVRLQLHEEGLDGVQEIYLERNGELSIIKKKPPDGGGSA